MASVAVDDKLLKHITDRIVERFHPRRIILFGSHARGDARPDSDVDLFIEMETDKSRYERARYVYELFGLRPWSMDVVIYTPDEFQRYKDWSFLKTIMREGKLLYERR
jgi:uncharacterized protein